MGGTLKAFIDGVPMKEEHARAFWARFSAYMEEHKGDLAGFARAEGFASVHPVMGSVGAELHASRTTAQRAYATARRSGPGSNKDQPRRKKRR